MGFEGFNLVTLVNAVMLLSFHTMLAVSRLADTQHNTCVRNMWSFIYAYLQSPIRLHCAVLRRVSFIKPLKHEVSLIRLDVSKSVFFLAVNTPLLSSTLPFVEIIAVFSEMSFFRQVIYFFGTRFPRLKN
jgi:hypothetical protein